MQLLPRQTFPLPAAEYSCSAACIHSAAHDGVGASNGAAVSASTTRPTHRSRSVSANECMANLRMGRKPSMLKIIVWASSITGTAHTDHGVGDYTHRRDRRARQPLRSTASSENAPVAVRSVLSSRDTDTSVSSGRTETLVARPSIAARRTATATTSTHTLDRRRRAHHIQQRSRRTPPHGHRELRQRAHRRVRAGDVESVQHRRQRRREIHTTRHGRRTTTPLVRAAVWAPDSRMHAVMATDTQRRQSGSSA